MPVTSCRLPNPLPLSVENYERNAIGLGGKSLHTTVNIPAQMGITQKTAKSDDAPSILVLSGKAVRRTWRGY